MLAITLRLVVVAVAAVLQESTLKLMLPCVPTAPPDRTLLLVIVRHVMLVHLAMSPPLVVVPVLYALVADMPEGRAILCVPYVLVEPMLLWRVWGHVLSVMPVTTVIVVVVSAVIVSRVAIVTKDLINAAPAHQGPSQLQIIVVLVINAWQEHGRRVVVVVVLLVLLVNTLLLVLVAAPAA